MQKPLLMITDPWNTLSHRNDTTLRLLDESISMGFPAYWSSSDQALSSTPKPQELNTLRVVPVLESAQSFPFTFQEMLTSTFHQIHYRVDPPVDFNYISVLDQLSHRLDGSAKIMNPPAILKGQSEKIPPKELAEHTPKLCAVLSPGDILITQTLFNATGSTPEFIVTKPNNLAQSLGVKKWKTPTTAAAWETLLATETEKFTKGIVVQEYLPQVQEGEVRLWYVGETLIGTLKKHPKKGDFRVLIDEGSAISAYTLSSDEHETAMAIGAMLKKQGVGMAAIDLIGGKISDYNITSPGLLVQMEQVYGGKNFARTVIEKLYE